MSDVILVTGATGNIGYYVVRELVAKNKKVRVAVRNVEKDRDTFVGLDVELVEFDFLKIATFEAALDRVDKVFLVRPPQLANPKKDMMATSIIRFEVDGRLLKKVVLLVLMNIQLAKYFSDGMKN